MLILLSIIFPILSGIVLWHRNTRSGQNGHALYGAAIIITDVLAVLTMFFGKPVTLFSLSPKVTFSFSLDVMGKWFLFVSMVLYTCCLFYSFIYMKVQEREPTFYAFYFVSFGALIAVCCAANMVTIYFAFELTTLSTVPLVLHEQTQAAVAAGLKFLFYSIGGALLGLFGVFFLYTYAGAEVSFVPGGVLDLTKTAGHEPILYLAIFLGVIGYGTKAGLFPMHGWLPTEIRRPGRYTIYLLLHRDIIHSRHMGPVHVAYAGDDFDPDRVNDGFSGERLKEAAGLLIYLTDFLCHAGAGAPDSERTGRQSAAGHAACTVQGVSVPLRRRFYLPLRFEGCAPDEGNRQEDADRPLVPDHRRHVTGRHPADGRLYFEMEPGLGFT